jgi:hypothetical protein
LNNENKTEEQIAGESHLDNLLNEVDPPAIDESAAGASQSVTVTDEYRSLEGLLSIVPMLSRTFGYKRVAAVWSDEAREALSNSLIPVLVKFAWGQRIIQFLRTGSGVEEAALFFAIAPLAMGPLNAIDLDKADIVEVQNQAKEKAENDAKNQ